jgi:hypothetical protein
MSNKSIIEELVDIIDNTKTSLKEKKKLLKIKLNNIYSILNAYPSKESNIKLRKIKILIKNIDNIKNYTELKKIFNLNLLYNLLDFDNKLTKKSEDKIDLLNLDLIKSENSKDYNKKLNINISEDNKDNEDESEDLSEEDVSEDVSEEDVSDEGSYENDTDDSDDDIDDYTDDDTDDYTEDENNSYDNSDDENINYLINKLPNKEKVKLLLKLAKLKNDHAHKMQLEMNKHKEIMYDKKIKELKIKNKYNLEKTRYKK